MFLRIFSLLAVCASAFAFSHAPAELGLTDALLRQMVARAGSNLADPSGDYFDDAGEGLPRGLPGLEDDLPRRVAKEFEESQLPGIDYDLDLTPSIRDQEYLQHSSLFGNPFISGVAAGDGFRQLKPTGEQKTNTEIKNGGVLPAYCTPPNPCPLGYTAADGCLEEFENTAGFSREFQAYQDCMCDTEHMFECPDSTRDSEITALARSIQNEGVMENTLDKIIDNLAKGSHSKVMKKAEKAINPFLQGEKLPIAAKKGHI